MTASPIKLTPRPMTAVRYVRPGHLLCDVGTDHAYRPSAMPDGCADSRPLPDGVQSPAGTVCHRVRRAGRSRGTCAPARCRRRADRPYPRPSAPTGCRGWRATDRRISRYSEWAGS